MQVEATQHEAMQVEATKQNTHVQTTLVETTQAQSAPRSTKAGLKRKANLFWSPKEDPQSPAKSSAPAISSTSNVTSGGDIFILDFIERFKLIQELERKREARRFW